MPRNPKLRHRARNTPKNRFQSPQIIHSLSTYKTRALHCESRKQGFFGQHAPNGGGDCAFSKVERGSTRFLSRTTAASPSVPERYPHEPKRRRCVSVYR